MATAKASPARKWRNDNAARDAIKGLNETQHDGRPLTVNEARPREERGGGGGGGRGYGGGGRRY